jgi:hypothetical protein
MKNITSWSFVSPLWPFVVTIRVVLCVSFVSLCGYKYREVSQKFSLRSSRFILASLRLRFQPFVAVKNALPVLTSICRRTELHYPFKLPVKIGEAFKSRFYRNIPKIILTACN